MLAFQIPPKCGAPRGINFESFRDTEISPLKDAKKIGVINAETN